MEQEPTGDVNNYIDRYINIKKIKKNIGWKPKVSFEKGVKNLLKQISYWKNAPVWDKSSIKVATKTWFKYL